MKQTPLIRSPLGLLLLVAIIPTLVIVGAARAVEASEVWVGETAPPTPIPEPLSDPPELEILSPYYALGRQTLPDGRVLEVDIIGGPPNPPAGFEAQRAASNPLRADAVLLPNFPSFDWVFGCSAVSGAMIAGYYDNQGYPNMYTGPTNGGVMPVTDTSWPSWDDGDGIVDNYPNNPLVASHDGVDGYVGYGSIDDYWVSYNSTNPDPFISGEWLQHSWETAIGDFMKTSQSSYGANPWNVDGSTTFYSYTDGTKLTCTEMISYGIAQDDGTYGRKLFYEARGYNVGDCFSQWTDYQHVDGFTLADFQVEINSGHPVFINLQGHSVVGFGYDGSTIYIRDTWDSNPDNIYSMTWGGSYAGMELHSVSIVQLSSNAVPGAFAKSSPANESIGISLSPTLSWSISFDANNYDYCYDTLDDGVCNTTWVDNGANTSVELSGLSPGMTYFWQVRAVNDIGTTFSEGSEAAFWEFTTGYPPGAFSKTSPTDGSINVPLSPTLTWTESSGADGYEYCLDTIDNDVCDTSWVENFTSTSVTLSGLSPGMTYFWQVRAVNEGGVAYADGEESDFWTFKTKYRLHLPIILKE